MNPAPPIALTIAGSDSSAGAGLQADLKTFAAHDVYGVCAVTAIVAEVPGRWHGSMRRPDPIECSTQECSVDFFPFAVKNRNACHGSLVAAVIDFVRAQPRLPLIVDPVIRAGAGAVLLDEAGLALMKSGLLTLAPSHHPESARGRDPPRFVDPLGERLCRRPAPDPRALRLRRAPEGGTFRVRRRHHHGSRLDRRRSLPFFPSPSHRAGCPRHRLHPLRRHRRAHRPGRGPRFGDRRGDPLPRRESGTTPSLGRTGRPHRGVECLSRWRRMRATMIRGLLPTLVCSATIAVAQEAPPAPPAAPLQKWSRRLQIQPLRSERWSTRSTKPPCRKPSAFSRTTTSRERS